MRQTSEYAKYRYEKESQDWLGTWLHLFVDKKLQEQHRTDIDINCVMVDLEGKWYKKEFQFTTLSGLQRWQQHAKTTFQIF